MSQRNSTIKVNKRAAYGFLILFALLTMGASWFCTNSIIYHPNDTAYTQVANLVGAILLNLSSDFLGATLLFAIFTYVFGIPDVHEENETAQKSVTSIEAKVDTTDAGATVPKGKLMQALRELRANGNLDTFALDAFDDVLGTKDVRELRGIKTKN